MKTNELAFANLDIAKGKITKLKGALLPFAAAGKIIANSESKRFTLCSEDKVWYIFSREELLEAHKLYTEIRSNHI